MYTHPKNLSQNEALTIPDIIVKTKMNHMVQKKSYPNLKTREGKYDRASYLKWQNTGTFFFTRNIYIYIYMAYLNKRESAQNCRKSF